MQYEVVEQRVDKLVRVLNETKLDRNKSKTKSERQNPTKSMRERILLKTGGKCHICGGELGKRWHADHVLPHVSGGGNTVENFLGSCSVCNNARWYFSPNEIKLILKLGRMAQTEIRKNTSFGRSIAKKYIIEEEKKKRRSLKRKNSI